MPTIAPISRSERRLMHKAIHKTCDKTMLADSLHSGTGKVSYIGDISKNSRLFIRL